MWGAFELIHWATGYSIALDMVSSSPVFHCRYTLEYKRKTRFLLSDLLLQVILGSWYHDPRIKWCPRGGIENG